MSLTVELEPPVCEFCGCYILEDAQPCPLSMTGVCHNVAQRARRMLRHADPETASKLYPPPPALMMHAVELYVTMDDGLESAFADAILSVCRTVVGDELRSITYFTEDQVEQLYLRSDLDRTADLVGFAELERNGFRADELYRDTQLGEYQATVRMFEYGYLTRVIHDRYGAWVTTDSMSMDRFEELTTALKSVLEAHAGDTTEK